MKPSIRACAAVIPAVGALALPSTGALATPPGGAVPSHNGASVKLSVTRVAPGGHVRVTGKKFPAAKKVSIKLDDDTVGVIAILKVGRDGRFSGSVKIPANAGKVLKAGRHWLRFLAPASKVNGQSNTSVKKTFTLTR